VTNFAHWFVGKIQICYLQLLNTTKLSLDLQRDNANQHCWETLPDSNRPVMRGQFHKSFSGNLLRVLCTKNYWN